jgi:drug/metabolite transporter (DMT)-like permease
MERFRWRALVGAVVALAGSILIFFQPGSVDFGWGALLLLGLAALTASEAVVVSKRVGRQHPLVTNFVGMTAGAAALLLASLVAGERVALPQEGETQLAVLYLVAATVGLFSLVLIVVQRWTASATSFVFVLMPVVAVAMGAVLADEQITLTTVLGGAIVCGGVYLGALARR